MARYSYKCDSCGYQFDEYHAPEKRNDITVCSMCGSPSHRDFKNEIKGGRQDALMTENERWSWSMGCHVDDIPTMMKKFPGSEYNERGQLRIRNRQHKKEEMKRRNMEEYN